MWILLPFACHPLFLITFLSYILLILSFTATTHDQEVFSFHSDHSPCHGFEEVLACYKKIAPNLRLSGWFLVPLDIC